MRRRFAVATAAVLALVTAWLGAQALVPLKSASELMPAGALFYMEARNFSKLVSEWDASPEKAAWLASPNYQVFSRSHLMTRLDEARKSYAEAAEIDDKTPVLAGIAGGESAVAFYNIGKLEFLYIAQISTARFADSALGKVKQRFESRQAGGHDYFIKTKGDSTIAFALVDNRLILGTREDLVAGALQLMAGEKLATLREEPWFNDALGKAPQGEPDIRFVGDLERTTKTHQFRSYWVERNVSEVRQFAWEVADLKFESTQVREDRVLQRREAQDSLAPAEPGVAELLSYRAAGEAGFHQAVAKPQATQVSALLIEKLFGRPRAVQRQAKETAAPGAPDGAFIDGEDDYETRVDSPVVAETSVDVWAPLSALAANTDAMLQAGVSRTNAVLIGIDSVVALHGTTPWNIEEVKRALGQVAGAVWSVAPGSLQWRDRNGTSELNSATPLRFAIDGKVLVMSASPEWMSRVLASRKAAASQGASYSAAFQFSRELPAFEHMMKMIDYPSIPQGGTQTDAREPAFFSENMTSLAASLNRLDSISVTAHDTGEMVRESVVYRRK